MNNLNTHIKNYLEYCETQKRLDEKTLKAYKTDLRQFATHIEVDTVEAITSSILENYLSHAHESYKPKTVKRKIASVKAFFHYLEYREILEVNPFNKLHIKFREPIILPKTIPLHTVETFLATIYRQRELAKTNYQRKNVLRDIAISELLFSTGIRISELCALKANDIDLYDGTVLIYGKGAKERCMQIGNKSVLGILSEYRKTYEKEIENCNHFFANQSGTPVSDQAVRRMINKYCSLAGINQHITPHMFRHTFPFIYIQIMINNM